MDKLLKIQIIKSTAIIGMWGFAYLGKRSENQLLTEITKSNYTGPIHMPLGIYYGYALIGTAIVSMA